MNEGCTRSSRILRLPLILVLTQLCLVSAARAQAAQGLAANAPPPSQSADPASQAADASASSPADASSASPGLSPSADSFQYAPGQSAGPIAPPAAGANEVLPSGASAAPPLSLPYSTVEPIQGVDRNTFDPFSGQYLGTGANEGVGAHMGHLTGSASFGGLGTGAYYAPFLRRAPAPTDADLKLGPLYLYLYRLQADFLYTDNVNLTTNNRRSAEYAIITLNMEIIAQLTDDLQIAVYGSVIYLPLQNILAATESSTLEGGLGFLLGALPVLTAQVAYDTQVGDWPVRFADEFQTTTGHYSDSTRDEFGLFQGSDLQSGGNPNTFRSNEAGLRNANGSGSYEQQDYFSYYENTVSATTTGQLPNDASVYARAYRSDLWYNQGSRGLPTSRDDFYVQVASTKPEWRFEPYASYEVSHSSEIPGVFQIAHIGLQGPITDQLYMNASAGYFWNNQGQQDSLYLFELRHEAGPNTTEYLEIARGLSYFDDEVITTEYYLLSQVLGATRGGVAFADHSDFQELVNDGYANRSQEDVGARLTWNIGPLTTLNLTGVYTHQDFDDDLTTDTWTGRVTLSRIVSDSIFFQAFYQFQHYNANQPDRKYEENLVFLSLVKYFH